MVTELRLDASKQPQDSLLIDTVPYERPSSKKRAKLDFSHLFQQMDCSLFDAGVQSKTRMLNRSENMQDTSELLKNLEIPDCIPQNLLALRESASLVEESLLSDSLLNARQENTESLRKQVFRQTEAKIFKPLLDDSTGLPMLPFATSGQHDDQPECSNSPVLLRPLSQSVQLTSEPYHQ